MAKGLLIAGRHVEVPDQLKDGEHQFLQLDDKGNLMVLLHGRDGAVPVPVKVDDQGRLVLAGQISLDPGDINIGGVVVKDSNDDELFTVDNPGKVTLTGSLPAGENTIGGFNLISTRMERVTWKADNPMPGTTSADFEIRDTNSHVYNIDHSNAGIWEQVLVIENALDAVIRFRIQIMLPIIHEGHLGPNIWRYSDGGKMNPGDRFVFVPEVGPYIDPTASGTRIFALPDLRQRHWRFSIQGLVAESTPTEGELRITSIRGY